MHSSMIGKIEKAHRYAQEPDRIRLDGLSASFNGSHDSYRITLQDGHWRCTCHTFESHAVGTCAHIMALQQVMGTMLDPSVRYDVGMTEESSQDLNTVH